MRDAHNNLGNALAGRGQVDEAIAHYQKALEIKPDSRKPTTTSATSLAARGQVDEAIAQYQKALEIKPDYTEAHSNLGNLLAIRGQIDAAMPHLRKAMEIKPDNAKTRFILGVLLEQQDKTADAVIQWRETIRLWPNDVRRHGPVGAGAGHVSRGVGPRWRRGSHPGPTSGKAFRRAGTGNSRHAGSGLCGGGPVC